MQRDAVVALLEKVYDPETPAAEVEVARDALTKAVRAEESAALHDVHPEWLLRILERESPRVIAILLRYIPSHQSRYVVDRLPARIKDRMPHYVDAFSVPTPIVQIIRRRFEAHFESGATGSMADSAFARVTGLGYDDLPKFFRDLGLHEIALAFGDADARSIQILMKRLPAADARRLEERMHHLGDAPARLSRDAKFTILDIDVESVPADQFLFEVGLRAFAKACGQNESHVIRALSLKLEPRVGEWLMAQTTRKAGGGELGGMRQEMILTRLETLSRAGVLIS